jgi:hypothetical protein
MSFKQKYEALERDVHLALEKRIEESTYQSKHNGNKAIRVNVFDYQELTILHGRLTFIDSFGLEYSLYSDCSLEDLIDILEK